MLLTRQPDTICVVRLSAIGDTCHALAVVRRLQDNWPDTKITWIIGKTEASLLGNVDGVEFIIFDKSAGLAAYRSIAARLRHRRFDVALCMHASMRANFIFPLIRSPVRVGFDKARARDFQWLFTNRRIAPAAREHALDAMMAFATAIGAEKTPLRWDIPISAEDRAYAAGQRGDRSLVVLSPCSSARARNFRNWPADRFTSICRYLIEDRGCDVVVTGGNTTLEASFGEMIAADGGAKNLVAATSLRQLFALIAAADLVICPDSGPAHMATAAGTPVIGLYATSNPDRTGPYRSRALTVNRYPDALRRFLSKNVDEVRWGQRVRHEEAMSIIDIDDVKQKIDDFYER